MKKEDLNVKAESHLKIRDITDKSNPKSIISKRLFNKKININNKDAKEIKPI